MEGQKKEKKEGEELSTAIWGLVPSTMTICDPRKMGMPDLLCDLNLEKSTVDKQDGGFGEMAMVHITQHPIL